jgi:hypothetical protein
MFPPVERRKGRGSEMLNQKIYSDVQCHETKISGPWTFPIPFYTISPPFQTNYRSIARLAMFKFLS